MELDLYHLHLHNLILQAIINLLAFVAISYLLLLHAQPTAEPRQVFIITQCSEWQWHSRGHVPLHTRIMDLIADLFVDPL